MKKNNLVSGILVFIVMGVAAIYIANNHYHFVHLPGPNNAADNVKALYYCPMHPSVTADKPGECPICHMSLIKKAGAENPAMGHKPAHDESSGGKGKVLYYRNPMNPQITSPVPMKDEMGMDYIPVYEEPQITQSAGIYIDPNKQQLIGVKKAKVEPRPLIGEIITVGRVAYDPNLYVAQQEYLQAIKSREVMSKTSLGAAAQQSDTFIETAKNRLMLMGMSEAEIKQVEASGQPQQNLYLPVGDSNEVWVYVAIYEYEAGFVEAGRPVRVEAVAYPGQIFEGKIISVAPILDPMTRSLKVRALVNNHGQKLKLEMFVNVRIEYNLGTKLAVPEAAVMHAGTKDLVYIVDEQNHFRPQTVILGAKVGNYYEVLKGLEPGVTVVTSANFLIDSESKLNAVLNQTSE